MKPTQGILAAIAIIIIGTVVFVFQQDDEKPEVKPIEPVVEPQAPAFIPPVASPLSPVVAVPVQTAVLAEPEPSLIPAPNDLDGSDFQVGKLIAEINPQFSKWLLPKEQIRKWVATIDMMADGNYPRKYPAIDFPLGKFVTETKDGSTVGGSSNNQRANQLINAVTALDPKTIASYYHHWQPIFNKAYQELGKKGNFDQRFKSAVEHVIKLEQLPEASALKQPHVYFEYKDSKLENRSDLDKLIWRLGPENQQALQQFLVELKKHI